MRDLLAASVPHFQLGEGSDGLGLLSRAREFANRRGCPELASAMELFIREEQRHSAVLGRWMDQEGIPRLRKHWVDSVFRRVRSLAGFELMISVLTSAECIAVPYYTALLEATDCPLLRALALRILRDEAFHLEFQADNAALCAQGRGELGRLLTGLAQFGALSAACALVYGLYQPLFRKARMSPLRFWTLAVEAQRPILARLAGAQSSSAQSSSAQSSIAGSLSAAVLD